MTLHHPGNLPAVCGTYTLLLYSDYELRLRVGRLGEYTLPSGWLAYVGSAHGPGGLRARVGRHFRQPKPIHWHIDALTAHLPICLVWYRASSARLECGWAAALSDLPRASIPIAGFGSSDCRCGTHLFALPGSTLSRAWEALDYPDRLVIVL